MKLYLEGEKEKMNDILMIVIAVLALFTLLRIFLGPTIWDRLLGLNLLSSKILILIALYSFHMEKSYLLDIAIVYALLGFISIIFIARFFQGKGDI